MKLCQTLRNADRFRTVFDFGGREVAHWFPGHMAKGLKQMKANLKNVDCILEIHDARISFKTSHSELGFYFDLNKPHLLVLNKMDLADLSNKQKILKKLENDGVRNVLFTDCLKQRDDNVKKLVPLVMELIKTGDRFNREENRDYCLMVIGVPNVGKSSLINALRRTNVKKGRASRVGGEPGITKAVLTKIQVSERPLMYLLDTPGVLPPKIESVETGMKLALCGELNTELSWTIWWVKMLFVVFISRLPYSSLFGCFVCRYVEKYDLQEPSDDIQHVLKRIAVKLRKTQRVKAITGVGNITVTIPNYTAAAYNFIRAFRKGELGQVLLD
uniref:Mitochondrial GTPase 1 n=1 Tax=Poecilia mexicana TaxID=48701 RepID=A0A3B3WMH0_9TELE